MRMQGYWGRVLVVDMTEETAQELPIPEEWFRAYVGGEGLAVRLFRYMADPVMPASEPDNPVVIAAGPLTGAPLDGCDLGAAAFRSPDGRGIGTARLGGAFPVALKKSGFDALVIMGAAESPSLLSVDDEDGAQVVDAEDLWDSDAAETARAIAETLKGTGHGVLAIGREDSDEGLSPFESVFAEKRLKAVVVQGSMEPEFADTGAMKRLGTGASSSEDVSDLSLTGASVADAGHASRLLSAALGRPVSGDELLSAAERVRAMSCAVMSGFGGESETTPSEETLLRLGLEWLL